MVSTPTLIVCYLLFVPCVSKVQGPKKQPMPEFCEAQYTDRSLTKPCGYCAICVKVRRPDQSSVDYCNHHGEGVSKMISKPVAVQKTLTAFWYCTLKDFCSMPKPFKVVDTEIDCKCSRSQGCINLFGTCKCVCDEGTYGQQCEFSVPSTTSFGSFADVRNVLYHPFVYVNDFVTVALHFYTTGTNLQVEIETRNQLLSFDSEHCEWNTTSVVDQCEDIFVNSGVSGYYKSCHGGPTYANHANLETCVINVNLAFSRDKPDAINKRFYYFDYMNETKVELSKKNIVAKVEVVTVVVKNLIPGVSDQTVYLNKFDILVIYSGKNTFENCLPFVTIPKFSKSMQHATNFPRKSSLSVSNLIVLKETPTCTNLGDPTINWFVWSVEKNHDEKNNKPVYQLLGKDNLVFEPFSLDFGMYKIKTEIKFVRRSYNRGIAYCFFKVVPVPLQPLIIGGSLRYIYYKSNLKLKTEKSNNPNFPADQQPTLEYTWYCNDTTASVCDKVSTVETQLIKQAPFIPGKEYTFSMDTLNPSTQSSESTSQIIVVSSDPMPSLIIHCLKNCGGKGYKSDFREIFYFRVVHSEYSYDVDRTDTYSWTYSENNQTFQDVADIRQIEVTPNSVLIVNENSLKNHEKYTFEVVGGGLIPGKAQIIVHTFKDSKVFSCEIHPKSGTAGLTQFHVHCSGADFEEGGISVLYYYYDKSGKEDPTGRLLATTYIRNVKDLVLTRGTVAIYATNMFGHFFETYINVDLTCQNVSADLLRTNINLVNTFSTNQGYEQKISFISSFCDILSSNPTLKETAIETFLDIINQEEVSDLVQVELLLSATQSVVCNKGDCKTALKSDISYKHLSEILRKISNKLADEIIASKNKGFPSVKLNILYASLIKCMGVLLSANDEMVKQQQNERIDYKRYNLFKFGNLKAIQSLEKVNRALAIVNLPYVKHRAVQTEYIETWMKTDSPSFFTLGTKGTYNGSYIVLSPELENILKTKNKIITVQITKFDNNPYWFSQSDDVATEVCLVSFGFYNSNNTFTPIHNFRYPVDMFLKKKPVLQTSIFGKVIQPDPRNNSSTNDIAVDVSRLFPKRGETISVKFLNMNDKDTFRVLIMINFRPDYDQLVAKGVLISKTKPLYSHGKAVDGDEDTIYIGIIPGPDVVVGSLVNYEYELEGSRCQIWHEYLWATTGCNLGPGSSEEFLHCQCNHLSSVAGFLNVPANTIDPFQDYTLFLTIPDNPYVFLLVVLLLLTYILLLIWTVRRDKVDMLKRSVLILEDNISTDTYGYLLTVITGSKCYAGTSSSIGVILHGSDCSSRSHILQSSQRRTLQRNDDWFLMFTPKHLGTISSIQLWTDHKGPHPNWFCDTINIHDLSQKKDYTFMIGKWFGITELRTRFESFARPVKFTKEDHFTEFTTTNIISGLREFHLWMSVFMHHPRSPILRAQRLSMAMVALITIILASILFYDVSFPEDVDMPAYDISLRELMISIYSLLISIVITQIIYLLFKLTFRSKKYKMVNKDNSAHSQESSEHTRLVLDKAQTLKVSKDSQKSCKYYWKRIILMLRKHEFRPVEVSTTPSSPRFCNTFSEYFAWTICLSTIFVAAFFVVWIGLKLGKVKSLMWLTSIGMSFGEDFILADPLKICFIAFLFGLVQTQLCDVFSYDPNIYKIRTKSNIRAKLGRDNFIHRMRFQKVYKHLPLTIQEILKNQQYKVKKWWVLLDSMDIIFSSIIMFTLILQVVLKDYYQTNTTINRFLLKDLNLGKNLVPSPEIRDVQSYSEYLRNRIFPEIYRTQWYNKEHLTSQQEILPETGWFGTLTNRLIGVPRLRQIRVEKKKCNLPRCFTNESNINCNVLFSSSTEDDDDYGAEWKYASWSDIMFKESPWSYLSPVNSSSISMWSESRGLFHGGGYVAVLKNNRRGSSGAVLNLIESDWLDLQTRIVFFEITAYNVNNRVFSSVIFSTEHLQNNLVLSGGGTWSIILYDHNIFLEALFFLYAVVCLFKLSMQMKSIGTGQFFRSFWTVYDLLFVFAGVTVFMIYRVFSKFALTFVHEFQTEGKDEFCNFQTLIFYLHLKRFLLGLLFIMAIMRTLRLTDYGSTRIFAQLKNTLYFSWPGIVSVTLILMAFMFVLQWMVTYLINTLYPTGYSHLLLRKMEYPSIYRSVTSQENVNYIFLPCFISSLAVACIITILAKNYTWAKTASKKF